MLEHRCSEQFPPLLIYRDPIPGIIITPEGLKEPTIKQGVFGSITLPVDGPLPVDDTVYAEDGTVLSNTQPTDESFAHANDHVVYERASQAMVGFVETGVARAFDDH